MKLNQLIELTLNEIALGVHSARETSRDLLAIAPATIDGKVVDEITFVEFDLTVVVEDAETNSSGKEKAFGGELRILTVGGSGKAQTHRGESRSLAAKATHRIAFKVPVSMGAKYIVKRSDS